MGVLLRQRIAPFLCGDYLALGGAKGRKPCKKKRPLARQWRARKGRSKDYRPLYPVMFFRLCPEVWGYLIHQNLLVCIIFQNSVTNAFSAKPTVFDPPVRHVVKA